MADNKRKKEDFSASLKKASEKLKPRDLRQDTVTIMIGGVPTPIVRHDMDDEAWGNVVRQSIKEAKPSEFKQPFPDRQSDPEVLSAEVEPPTPTTEAEVGMKGEGAALKDQLGRMDDKAVQSVQDVKKSIDWPRLVSLGQNLDTIDKSLVSDEEKGHLKGMSEWSRAEFLRERMRKHGYEVPKTTAEAERESFKKEAVVEEAPPEGVPSEKTVPPKGGTVTEDTVTVGSNTPSIRNPASFVPQMALGATGEQPPGNPMLNALQEKVAPMEGGFPGASNPAPVEGGFPGLAGGDAGVAQANAKGAQHGTEDLAALQSLVKPVQDGLNMVNQFNPMNPASWTQPVENIVGSYERNFNTPTPDGSPLPNQVIPPGRNPDGTEKVPQHTPSPPSTMPTGPGGSEAMKLSLAGGGGFAPAQVDPKAKALQAQSQAEAIQAQRDARARIDAEGENQRAITDKAAEIEVNERQKADMLGALATQAQLEATQKAENWSNARAAAAATARDAAANPIDPNRYWNNKNDGQKAFAVLAGALYGFSGQGMQWLQRIDGLVDADNRLQAADRASKVEGLNRYAAEMGAQADDAMKFGLSKAQAHLLARTQKLEGLKSQLDILNMRQTDSIRRQQGEMMSAALAQHIDQIANQGLSLAQQEAQMRSADRYHNAQLAMQRMELGIKAATAGAKAAKGEPLPAAVSKRLDESMAIYQKVAQLAKLAKNNGVVDRAGRMMSEGNPLGGQEAANAEVYQQLQVELMKDIAGGALQAHEVELIKPLVGGARSAFKDSYPTANTTADRYRKQLIRTLRGEAAAGRDVSSYLEVLRATEEDLRGNEAPSYATPR